MQQTFQCPKCGSQNTIGQQFCGACGQELQSSHSQHGARVDASQAQMVVRRQLESTNIKHLKDVEFTTCWYSAAGSHPFWDVQGLMLTKKKVGGSKKHLFRFQVDSESGNILGYQPFEALGKKGELRSEEKAVRKRGFLETMGCSAGCLAIIVIFVLLLVGAVVGAEAYGYSQLQTSFQAQEVSPEIPGSRSSIWNAILNIFSGDLYSAVTSIVTGLNVEGTLTVSNPSFIPLYIPAMNHEVAIEGKKCPRAIRTQAMFIAPSSRESQRINLLISLRDLPEMALRSIANGGAIHISIVSEIGLGEFAITKTTYVQTSISKPLSSYRP